MLSKMLSLPLLGYFLYEQLGECGDVLTSAIARVEASLISHQVMFFVPKSP